MRGTLTVKTLYRWSVKASPLNKDADETHLPNTLDKQPTII